MRAYLFLLLIMIGLSLSNAYGFTTHTNDSIRSPLGLLFNLSIAPRDLNFNQDPAFYSFEAYHLLPPPNVSPIKVIIVQNVVFNNSGLTPYVVNVYVPRGNYSLILMNVGISEVGGAQYDRPVYIFADGVPVFWGSTQEFLDSTAGLILHCSKTCYRETLLFSLFWRIFMTQK